MKYIVLFNIFFISILSAQSFSPISNIDSLVNELSQGELSGPYIGMMGMGASKSLQYLKYKLLAQIASTEKLLFLANHKNPVIRCYALSALSEREVPNIYQTIQPHLSDTSRVTSVGFDMIMDMSVGEYLEYSVLSPYFDSLKPTNDSVYSFLRNLVLLHKHRKAIVALSKYKREQDINLILSNYDSVKYLLPEIAQSIIEFPAPPLFRVLQQSYDSLFHQKRVSLFEMEYLFKAIVQFKTLESIELLDDAIKKDTLFLRTKFAIYRALQRYPDSYFDPIKSKIHLTEFDKEFLRTIQEYGD